MKKILLALWLALMPLAAHATAICPSVPYTFLNNTTADATQVNANFVAVLNCFNTGVASSGANSSITSLSGLTSPPIGTGSIVFTGTGVSGTNTIAVSNTNPSGFALTAGNRITFIAANTNTGATTLNVNSLGNTNIYKYVDGSGLVALSGGEIAASTAVDVWYDGTQFELLSGTAWIAATPSAHSNNTQIATTAYDDAATAWGAYTSQSFGTVLTAATNLIVIAYVQATNSQAWEVTGKVNGATVIINGSPQGISGTIPFASITFPVPKGATYEVIAGGSGVVSTAMNTVAVGN